jgi:ADP-ribosylglycohydrolase
MEKTTGTDTGNKKSNVIIESDSRRRRDSSPPPKKQESDSHRKCESDSFSRTKRTAKVLSSGQLAAIKGVVFGTCVGDAIGLSTEFMTKDSAEECYENIVQDKHRSQWKVGDWTEDSDQMFHVIAMLAHNRGVPNSLDFARRLKTWTQRGFKELHDKPCIGLGETAECVINRPEFEKEPHKAAASVWETVGHKDLPGNGAIVRTAVLGVCQFDDLDAVEKNTMEMSRVTHADPRCAASCVVIACTVAKLLQGATVKEAVEEAVARGKKCIEDPQHIDEFERCAIAVRLEDLHLGDPEHRSSTLKTMGAALWAIRQHEVEDTLFSVVMEGGDADANAAVAAALLGARDGIKALPKRWVNDLIHKDFAEKQIRNLLSACNYSS